MTAGAYCNREVVIAAPDTSVVEAARLMRNQHVGDLVVVYQENGQNIPVGIVTDRDLVVEVLAQEVAPAEVTLKDLMSTDLLGVREQETLQDTLSLMQTRGVRRVLIVNEQGGLEGILSADDAIEVIAESLDSLVKLVRSEIRHEETAHP
jgi:CBS domain-containing protein